MKCTKHQPQYNNTDIAAVTARSYTRHIRPLDRAGSHQLAVFRCVRFLIMKHNLITPTKYTQFIYHTHLLYFLYMFRCYIHSHYQEKLSKKLKNCP
jgi:hypothetical protein